MMSNGSKSRLLMGIAGIILGLSMGPDPALADNQGKFEVVPPDSIEFGNTYGEWSARWWQWLVSIPAASNPNFDTTGANCASGQTGQVWFLAGSFGDKPSYTRTCTIPGEKDVLVTLLTQLDGELGPVAPLSDCPDGPNECDLSSIRALAAAFNDNPQSLELKVDNMRVKNLDQYRVTSPVFNAFFPKNAIFDIPHGSHGPLVSDGYFVLLKALSPGAHTISIRAVNSDGFSVPVTYHLIVTK
jgi:hypothetical protein